MPRRRQAPRRDPRRRAQPDRPGDRVRLLLLPRGVRGSRPTATRRSSWCNSNPETVSTDLRHVRQPLLRAPDGRGRVAQRLQERIKPMGVIVQFGGQDAAEPGARALEAAGVVLIIGTSPAGASTWPRTGERFVSARVIDKLGLRQTPNGMATTYEEGAPGWPQARSATRWWKPVRPSLLRMLGGRAMEIALRRKSSLAPRRYISTRGASRRRPRATRC